MLNRLSSQSVPPMGQPSDDTIAAIKEAVDIVQLMSEYIRVEPFGSKYRALCPFHDDRKPSLQIDPQYQNYRCWACGAKGDVFKFLQEYEKITFAEAKVRLAERAGISLRANHDERVDAKAPLYKALAWAQKEFEKSLQDVRIGAVARQYLAERHFTEETARRYGLGFAPADFGWLVERAKNAGIDQDILIRASLAKISQRGTPYDFFRGRLIIPIRDSMGRVVAFGGRVLPSLDDGNSGKYLNSASTDVYNKSRVLYGLDVAAEGLRLKKRDDGQGIGSSFVVMEGYMDCLMAYQAGLPTCVATCGTALTADHVDRIKHYVSRVVLMFDGDSAGQKAAKASASLFLNAEVDLRLCVLPDELDPCDFVVERGLNQLEKLINDAPDVVDYMISRAQAAYDSSSVMGRKNAIDEVIGLVAEWPADLRSEQQQTFDLAINRIAEVFRVEEGTLRNRVSEFRRDKYREPARIRVDAPEEIEIVPLPKGGPERQIAEIVVVMPSRAGEIAPVMTVDELHHPDLRTIVEACYRVCEEIGEDATTDALRERLNDPRLDSIVIELVDTAPKGEAFERGLQDVRRWLDENRRHRDLVSSVRLGPNADADEHLATLRELQRRNAL